MSIQNESSTQASKVDNETEAIKNKDFEGEALMRWMTGITDKKTSTFKDVMDNIKNVATMVTIATVLGYFSKVANLSIYWKGFIGVAALIYMVMLIFQAGAVFMLRPNDTNNMNLRHSAFLFTLVTLLLVTSISVLTVYNVVTFFFLQQ